MNGDTGLLRMDSSFSLAPGVTDIFLDRLVVKALHELFKGFRDKTCRQETAILTRLWNDRKKRHKQDTFKWVTMWKLGLFSMCTQCAFDNFGYHPT